MNVFSTGSNDIRSFSGGIEKFGSWRTLADLAWSQRRLLAAASVCMGVSALATAAYAYLVGPVVRSLFVEKAGAKERAFEGALDLLSYLSARISAAEPWQIGGAIVAVAAVKGGAYFCHTSLCGRAGQRMLGDLRAGLYRGLLRLNPLNRAARSGGEISTKFAVEAESVENAVTGGLVVVLRDSLQILALAGLALMLDPMLGLVGMVAFPFAAALIIRIGKRLRSRRTAHFSAFGGLGAALEETASGLPVIRAFGAERLMERRFAKRNRTLVDAAVGAITLKAISSPINELLGALALGVTIWYAHVRIVSGDLAPEEFISFFTALFLLYQPVKEMGQAGHAVQSGIAALQRLAPLAASHGFGPAAETAGLERIDQVKEIRLKGVEAGYGDGSTVLAGLDLSIPVGSKIAVVGPSGAGKSTLVNLLQGFIPVSKGTVLLDGRQVDLDRSTARALFAPVHQEPFLFDDTIDMNVRCGRPGASDKEVEEACRAAGVIDMAESMADGMETRVGPRGEALSLGQRQRVCLARALLSKALVLLLDEVSASLDGRTEKALVERLDRFLAGRTALVVTHRLSTARWADQVALLESGTIRAVGPAGSMLDESLPLRELFGAQIEREMEAAT